MKKSRISLKIHIINKGGPFEDAKKVGPATKKA